MSNPPRILTLDDDARVTRADVAPSAVRSAQRTNRWENDRRRWRRRSPRKSAAKPPTTARPPPTSCGATRETTTVETPTLAPSPSPSTPAPASHTNRFGDIYYLHQGTTKTGKPRYFVARSVGAGALATMPEGYELSETLNGVVSVRRKLQRPSLVPRADVATVRTELARYPGLRRYAVDVRKDEIIIYEPERTLAPDVAELGRALGLRPRDSARRPEPPTWRTRYAPVMKLAFAFIGVPGVYLAYRRSYSLESGWWALTHGPLRVLLRRYLPVLGTEKFHELL